MRAIGSRAAPSSVEKQQRCPPRSPRAREPRQAQSVCRATWSSRPASAALAGVRNGYTRPANRGPARPRWSPRMATLAATIGPSVPALALPFRPFAVLLRSRPQVRILLGALPSRPGRSLRMRLPPSLPLSWGSDTVSTNVGDRRAPLVRSRKRKRGQRAALLLLSSKAIVRPLDQAASALPPSSSARRRSRLVIGASGESHRRSLCAPRFGLPKFRSLSLPRATGV
jgi:hypothetical protein